MKVIEKLCESIKSYNEDFIVCDSDYAFVLDGATGLQKNIISEASDAYWYVNTFASYLKKCINKSDVKQAIAIALKDIAKDIDKYANSINSNLDIPSACIALVKENKDNFEFFVLGDCSIIYGNKHKQTLLTNEDIRKMDNEKIQKMKLIAKDKGINISDAYGLVMPDLKQQRLLKNRFGGYYVLDIDEEVIIHANYKVVPKKDIEMIILLSDGFSTYYECLELEKNYKTFFLKNYNTSAKKLYNQLREREQKDPFLNNYPRFKISDDASIIKLKCD
ncbi:MAG: protein phosphatase 2C family protein [Bacilli bacterium]|nr:protein phosphatase 2C family protein [Bacilli bacterium]